MRKGFKPLISIVEILHFGIVVGAQINDYACGNLRDPPATFVHAVGFLPIFTYDFEFATFLDSPMSPSQFHYKTVSYRNALDANGLEWVNCATFVMLA